MYQQLIKGRQLSPLKGILLILLIVLLLYASNFLSGVVRLMTGFRYGSIVIWALAAVGAVFLMREAVMDYRYTLAEGKLYLERKFGEHTKILVTIPLCDVRDFGPGDEMLKKNPSVSPVERVILKSNPLPISGVTYIKDGALRLVLFQPDEKLLENIASRRGIHV